MLYSCILPLGPYLEKGEGKSRSILLPVSCRLPSPVLIERIRSAISEASRLLDQERTTIFFIEWIAYIVPDPLPFKHIASIFNNLILRNCDGNSNHVPVPCASY